MAKMVVLFPDTNIFLHYPPIKDIDWKVIAGADQVKLMVCLPVIDELDAKKSGHSLQEL